jgi:hypothetical protein
LIPTDVDRHSVRGHMKAWMILVAGLDLTVTASAAT